MLMATETLNALENEYYICLITKKNTIEMAVA